jgi:hypothetical protein
MTSLMIEDLPLAAVLDDEASCAVRGGLATYPTEPSDPGVMPGGCVHNPWGMPPLPALPALPEWWPLPGWPHQPSPTDFDPGLLQ